MHGAIGQNIGPSLIHHALVEVYGMFWLVSALSNLASKSNRSRLRHGTVRALTIVERHLLCYIASGSPSRILNGIYCALFQNGL